MRPMGITVLDVCIVQYNGDSYRIWIMEIMEITLYMLVDICLE